MNKTLVAENEPVVSAGFEARNNTKWNFCCQQIENNALWFNDTKSFFVSGFGRRDAVRDIKVASAAWNFSKDRFVL